MSNPTSNYNFQMPTSTDLVTDLPADFEVFGQAVDTQMKTNADAATQKATLTTKGDIYAATGTSTPARLAVGTNNQVLTVDSTTATGLKWATAASGGMTVLASGTLSGASLSLTGIVGTYRDLVLQIFNPSSVSGGGGGIEYSFNSVTSYMGVYTNSTTTTLANISGSFQIPMIIPSAANTYQFHQLTFTEYASTTSRKTGSFVASNSAADYFGGWSGASPTAAVTSITVITGGAGNWDAGTYVLYGVS